MKWIIRGIKYIFGSGIILFFGGLVALINIVQEQASLSIWQSIQFGIAGWVLIWGLDLIIANVIDKKRDEMIKIVDLGNKIISQNISSVKTSEIPIDELYDTAHEAVITAGKASTSYIQRKLGVGYSQAARLIDMLEEKGVIGPANGSSPRDVLESPLNLN